MSRAFRWVAPAVLLVITAGERVARADDESSAALVANVVIQATVFGTAAASTVVNTVQISRGRGSKFWGWAGIGSGVLVPVIMKGFNSEDSPWSIVAGGGVVALGVWSLIVANKSQSTTSQPSRLLIAPTVVRGRGHPDPGIVLQFSF